MFGGGGGLDPRKMQQMMEQMGVDFDELDVADATIRLDDGTELYFEAPDVNRIVAQGQETYQVVGDAEERAEPAAGEAAGGDEGEAEREDEADPIPEGDVEIVAQRTGAGEAAAREALVAADGDLAAAIERLE